MPLSAVSCRAGPYDRLWAAASSFVVASGRWYDTPLLQLDATEEAKVAENLRVAINRALRELRDEATGKYFIIRILSSDVELGNCSSASTSN